MQLVNVTNELTERAFVPVEFPGKLVQGEQSVAVTVKLDAEGAVIMLKQGDILLPRDEWVSASASPKFVVLATHGLNYADWIKKLKYEKKHPDETKTDLPSQMVVWNLQINPSKLGDETVQKIQRAVEQLDFANYHESHDAPESLHITRCPTCSTLMDVTPYEADDSIYCHQCNRLLNEPAKPEESKYGICTGCAYYTKLKASGDGNFCHPCIVKNTLSSFLYSLAAAVVIGLVNVGTIVFANRFFPALLLIGGVSFIWSLVKLASVIAVSAARTATGVTPLEKATAILRKGKTEEAMQIIESMPDAINNPGILLNLTRGLINQRNYPKALQFANVLVDQFPNFQYGFTSRLEALVHSGASLEDIQSASNDLNQVIARNSLRTPQQLNWLNP